MTARVPPASNPLPFILFPFQLGTITFFFFFLLSRLLLIPYYYYSLSSLPKPATSPQPPLPTLCFPTIYPTRDVRLHSTDCSLIHYFNVLLATAFSKTFCTSPRLQHLP